MPVRMIKGVLGIVFVLFGSAAFSLCAHANSHALEQAVSKLIDSGKVLGAQVILAEMDQILLERNLGVRSVKDPSPVESNTQFCIGSCSKPFASATTLVLAQKGLLNLDTPISHWIPQFNTSLTQTDQMASRSPSLRELLAHRGGIYSQKLGMNRRQSRWIRDFRLTLEEAVDGISKESLIFNPGTDFAYSGAGYGLVGRIAEIATDRSFEAAFQKALGVPLGLERTTYFPIPNDPNIATGSAMGKPNPSTPHLSRPFRLPLIGGSLYSTARETARFARMILERGRFGQKTILKPKTYQEFLSLPFDGQAYGLGWSIKAENNRPIETSHSGSLASSRATIRINLDKGRYAIVFYTLTDPSVSAETVQAVNRAISAAIRN